MKPGRRCAPFCTHLFIIAFVLNLQNFMASSLVILSAQAESQTASQTESPQNQNHDDIMSNSMYAKTLLETVKRLNQKQKEAEDYETDDLENQRWNRMRWFTKSTEKPLQIANEDFDYFKSVTIPTFKNYDFDLPTIDYSKFDIKIDDNEIKSDNNPSYNIGYRSSTETSWNIYIIVVAIAIAFKLIIFCCYYGIRRNPQYVRRMHVILVSGSSDRTPIMRDPEELAEDATATMPHGAGATTNNAASGNKVTNDLPPAYSELPTAPPSYEEARKEQFVPAPQQRTNNS